MIQAAKILGLRLLSLAWILITPLKNRFILIALCVGVTMCWFILLPLIALALGLGVELAITTLFSENLFNILYHLSR